MGSAPHSVTPGGVVVVSDVAPTNEDDRVRITVTLDDELLARASALTGITEESALLNDGLRALVRAESAHRLTAMGGSDQHATGAPRHPEGRA